MPNKNKKTIMILATGGTIAGIGENGKDLGYKPGSITVDELIKQVPKLSDIAEIKTIQICNINSDDMTSSLWIKLTNTINELANNDDIAGFVVTHGTDTLEETAYFLNLTIKTSKPVVVIGSVRPTTSISPDGPENLYNAVMVAKNNNSKNHGVMVVLANKIYSARDARKVNATNVAAFDGGEMGAIGIIIDGKVKFYNKSTKKHTTNSEFDVTNINTLPKVNLAYFYVDADPNILSFLANDASGLVIAGAGAGEYSIKWKEKIQELNLPIVITTRTYNGTILKKSLLSSNTIPGDNLTPAKAVVLLRLALNITTNKKEIERIFKEY